MKRIIILSTVIVFALFSTITYAGTGRTAAQFLSLGGGTRAAGMGDTFTAISGDVISAFWNPGGLGNISDIQMTVSYTNYAAMFGEASEGMYYGLAAFAMPVKDWGVFGSSIQIQDQGTMLITTDSPEPVGEEDLGMNWAWALSYADQLGDNWLAGVNAKIIRQKLWKESDTAYAADMGIQYVVSAIPLGIGLALQNLGTGIQMTDEYQTQPLPRAMKLGLVFRVIDMPSHRLQLLSDYTSFIDKLSETEEDSANPDFDASKAGVGIHAFKPNNSQQGVGAEYWYSNILGVRVGYKYIPDMPGDHITMGFSIRYSGYQFDYARVPGIDVPGGGDIDKVALMFRF
ncbi:PorV/PorQ family protein [Candidatus Poribacteria bacterium]|nr:PorV/PorQ family protein [Candidatus Poribacteria bacterium]